MRTSRAWIGALAGAMLAVLLAACGTTPPASTRPGETPAIPTTPPASRSGPPVPAELSDRQRERARAAEREGDLFEAASAWRLVMLMAPADATARAEAQRVEDLRRHAVEDARSAGTLALRRGNYEQAERDLLRALALDPDNGEIAAQLREAAGTRSGRFPLARATRPRRSEDPAGERATASAKPGEAGSSFALEQALAMFQAGDTEGGLNEMRRYVDANPQDRAGRRRLSDAVYEQGRRLDTAEGREHAWRLYQEALALRHETPMPAAWSPVISSARKALADDYYQRGMRLYRKDLDGAIAQWEACLKVDPDHPHAKTRLRTARHYREQLQKIP